MPNFLQRDWRGIRFLKMYLHRALVTLCLIVVAVEACEPWSCTGLHNRCSTACVGGHWLKLSGLVANIDPSYNKAKVKGGNAIDGDVSTCTESKNTNKWPTWSLNLGRRYQVAAIRITSKSQPAIDYYNTPNRVRLSGFSAGLRSNNGKHTRCATNVAIGNGETRMVRISFLFCATTQSTQQAWTLNADTICSSNGTYFHTSTCITIIWISLTKL